MTRLARNLILINTALSLAFLAGSLGLFFEAMPWVSYKKSDGETVPGRVDALAAQLAQELKDRDPTDDRWLAATREVIRHDSVIPPRRSFYSEQLKIAMTGLDNAGKAVTPSVQQLEIRNGLVDISKRTGRPPIKIDGKDALSVAAYEREIAKKLNEIDANESDTKKLAVETSKLSDEIKGTKPRAEAVTLVERGLLGQIDDTKATAKNTVLEQQWLQAPLTNYTVDLKFLERRGKALEARITELVSGRRNPQ